MDRFNRHRLPLRLLLLVVCLATQGFAEDQQKPEAPLPSSEVGMAPISFRPSAQVPEINVAVGKSVIADALIPIAKVSLATAAVADTFVLSPTQLLISGKGIGTTSLFVWDKNGKMQSYEVVVHPDVTQLRARMKEAFPNEAINVTALKDSVILSGPPTDEYVAKKAMEIASPVTKNLINLLQPPPPREKQRILLQVKIAEVDRSTARELGFNLFKVAGNMPTTTSTQQYGGAMLSPDGGSFTFSDALNVMTFRRDLNFGAIIRDLENRSLLQILAEPNLLAYHGKEATFLAGGEFPVPIVTGVGNGMSIGIQFREFGVRLSFTPTLMPNGAIHLKVKPEVSTIDYSNAAVIGGFRVPGLNTRRVETEIELNEGESFGIAGLIDNRVTESYSQIPGLANIPILGNLFKSRAKSKNNSELLVIVTPKIAQPFRPEQPPALPEMDTPYLREPKLDGKLGFLGPPPKDLKGSEPKLDGKSGYQDPAHPTQSGLIPPANPSAPASSLTPASMKPPAAAPSGETSKEAKPATDTTTQAVAQRPVPPAPGGALESRPNAKDPP